MICQKCGAFVPQDIQYCQVCGNDMFAQTAATENEPTVMAGYSNQQAQYDDPTVGVYGQPVAGYPGYPSPTPPEKKGKGKLIVIILVVFLVVGGFVGGLFVAGVFDKNKEEPTEKSTVEKIEETLTTERFKETTEEITKKTELETKKPTVPVTSIRNKEIDAKKAAENYVDILLISETSGPNELMEELSYIIVTYLEKNYKTPAFRENFKEVVGEDLDTYIQHYETDINSKEAVAWIYATMACVDLFGDFNEIANVSSVEIISSNVEIDEKASPYAEETIAMTANDLGISLENAPTFSGIAKASVDVLITKYDGTESTETIEMWLIEENGKWKVMPV